MTNWSTMEDALFDWVQLSSGLSADKIQWTHYSQPRLTGQFITIMLSGPKQIGLDYVQTSTDLTQPAGEEIELKVIGNRNMLVTVTCFGGDPTTDSSIAMASKVMLGPRLPSINTLLHAGGVTPHGTPSITNIPSIVGAKFESRAMVEHEFYFSDDVSERTGFISTVSGTGTVSGTIGPVEPINFIITI